jgi:hypothetical protein
MRRIQFDRQPALITYLLDRAHDGREINGAVARNEMLMDARRGDVFQVEVADVLGHARNGRRRIVADAIGMAHVEVQPHGRRVDVLHELQKLVGRLDQQARLWFHEQQYAFLLRMIGDGLDPLDEQLERRFP